MVRLRVHNFTLSLDGYAAGPGQRAEQPLGQGGFALHEWIFQTAGFRSLQGEDGGDTGLNDELFRARTEDVGATIMGRNMFGPLRGPWEDESWRGWWGEDPPFRHDVFVLTHHPRSDLAMRNGTTFHFIEAQPHEALAQATKAAGGQDVVLGGGASTTRQFLTAGLVDALHLVIAPVLLGSGERLFDSTQQLLPQYSCAPLRCEAGVGHVHLTRI
ncbi:MAG: dihydrofolate reductase family protein [Acidimicrobiales bacterium]